MANFEQQSTRIQHLICFGNPLLDHSFRLENEILLMKYNLQKDVQSELSDMMIKAIIKDAYEMYHEPDLNTGGSALNTCKILRQIGQSGLLFCGAIGDDENGKTITQLINECRINSCMDTKADHPTGVCVCLVLGDKRSLHACIGAAQHFFVDFFETDEWKTKISEYNQPDEVSLFYIEGFFIPGREDVIKYILNKYINRHVFESNTTENVTDDAKILSNDLVETVIEDITKSGEFHVSSEEIEESKKSEDENSGVKETTGNNMENVSTNDGLQQDNNESKLDNPSVPVVEELKLNKVQSPPPINHESNKTKVDPLLPPNSPGVQNLFATNLNAAYIVKEYSETVKLLVESADLIFGNREEFEALATIYEDCQTIQDVVQLLMRKEAELDRLKIFVITNGQDPVSVYYGTDNDFRWHRYDVPSIPSEKVIDTTGAGDSFIAGFLHKFMNQGLLADCIANGCEIARQVVQNVGCNLI